MSRSLRFLLAFIIAVEVALGVLYAIETPRWQAPDEPAQFNYVRHIAETGTLPELRQGDYDQALLERLKAAKFPPGESIDGIRYESYQPPLYYLLAAPFYLAARKIGTDPGLALRLLDVALGALLLYLAYRVLRFVFLRPRWLAVAGVGLIATVPMHVAMSAAINADSLTEIIVALLLLVSIMRSVGRLSDRRFVRVSGILYGLALLTSTKIYAAGLLPVLGELIYRYRCRRPASAASAWLARSARTLLPFAAISLVLSAWWFVRNALLYGGLDVLGWGRHDLVVRGQLTTAQAIAQDGRERVVADFFTVTFKSFWAQFGWMGVLVDERIYLGLFLLSAVAVFGAGLWLWRTTVIPRLENRGAILIPRLHEGRPASFLPLNEGRATSISLANHGRLAGRSADVDEVGPARPAWSLLGAWLGLVLLAHVYYNFRYVQDQGRYLFPALIPIAAFLIVGLAELLNKHHWRIVFGLLYVVMLGLDYISLFWFIIPQLRT